MLQKDLFHIELSLVKGVTLGAGSAAVTYIFEDFSSMTVPSKFHEDTITEVIAKYKRDL